MPVLSEMLRDIEELAPSARLLNYVNPMGMLTWAALDASPVPFVGLCHSVQGTAEDIADFLEIPFDQFWYRAAGINHMSWYLEMKRGEEDVYPRFREAAKANEEYSRKNRVCLDLMSHFGYFVAESSRHHSEYYPYFRKNAAAAEEYGFAEPRKVDPEGRSRNDARWESERLQAVLAGREPVDLSPSNEFAAEIMDAVTTGRPARIYANVRNGGLIPNLPADCIVEVPTLVDHNGWQPCYFGALPSQLAALSLPHVSVQRLAVEAWRERSREKAIQAIALDPLTAAVCTLGQAREMANELLDSQPELLGYLE
jgi:alpha-galactosidase